MGTTPSRFYSRTAFFMSCRPGGSDDLAEHGEAPHAFPARFFYCAVRTCIFFLSSSFGGFEIEDRIGGNSMKSAQYARQRARHA
jgi:hypothetical protein